jgi:hypothetical protein
MYEEEFQLEGCGIYQFIINGIRLGTRRCKNGIRSQTRERSPRVDDFEIEIGKLKILPLRDMS